MDAEPTLKPRKQYLSGPSVQKRYDISDRTLDTWLNDERLDFPRPIYLRGRRYFALNALESFERSQVGRGRRNR